MKLRAKLREARPNIRDSTLTTYVYNLNRLTKLIGSDKYEDQIKKIGKLDLTPSIHRNLVTAAIVHHKAFKKPVDKLVVLQKSLTERYNESVVKQRKTPTDKKKWISREELIATRKYAIGQVRTQRLWKKKDLTFKQLQTIQIAVLLEYYSQGAPMRNDVGTCKIYSEFEYRRLKKKVNALVVSGKKLRFEFWDFKTSKSFAKRGWLPLVQECNKRLTTLLHKYLKVKPNGEHLFYDSKGKSLEGERGRRAVGNRLRYVFQIVLGKNISSGMLRKLYLTELLKFDTPLEQKEMIMRSMGQSSLRTQASYVRKD